MVADSDKAGRIVFRVLGRFTVDDNEVRIGSKPASLLAMLLLAGEAVVPLDHILRALWGEEQPRSGSTAVAAHVARIRKQLSGITSDARLSLDSVRGGYRLQRPPRSVDLEHFRFLVDRAANAPTVRTKAELLDEALAMRGEPLDGISGLWAAETRIVLRQEQVDVVLAAAKARIELGDTEDAIGRLTALAEEEPLAEPTRELLIQTLIESGRKTDALEVYKTFETLLSEHLGIAPGPRLRAMRNRILHGSPSTSRTTNVISGVAANAVVQVGSIHGDIHFHPPRSRPMMAPPPPTVFVNREKELARLIRLLDPTEATGSILVRGQVGIGKTGLMLRVAEEARKRDWFPGGELFADLGKDPTDQVLTRFVRALGVRADEIPTAPDRLAALYRSQVMHRADRRILVMLDNVEDEAQLRPLLPASDNCAILISTRAVGAELGAVHAIDVPPFTPETVTKFLRARPGGRDLHPQDAAEIARLSAGLPLALKLIADRMSNHDPREVLRELGTSGPDVSAIEALFTFSINQLDESDARFLHRLALNPTGETSFPVAVVLGDESEAAVTARLETLAHTHLVDWQPETGRVRIHDLIRAFLRNAPGTEEDHEPAVGRMLGLYLRRAREADLALDPGEIETGLSKSDASAWMSSEVSNLHGAVSLAAETGSPVIACNLARALYWFHASRGTWADLGAVTKVALEAAVTSGDRAGEALSLSTIADCHAGLDRLEESMVTYRQALAINEELGDVRAQGSVLSNLGGVQLRADDFPGAGESYRAALDCFRELGDQRGEVIALINLARTYREIRRGEEAVNLCERAFAVYRDLGDRRGEAIAMQTLGDTLRATGKPSAATGPYRRAVNIYRELDDGAAASNTLDALAATLRTLGRENDAAKVYDRAFDVYRERPPDRTTISADQLISYLTTSPGRAGWERIVTMAGRSVAAGPELAHKVQDHRERPMNKAILADLFRLLQDVADRDDDLAILLAGWAAAAEAAENSGRSGSVHNVVSGNVSGTVIQARDLFGSTTSDDQF